MPAQLAATGAHTAPLVTIAVALIGLGFAALTFGNRRSASTDKQLAE
jgi:hypothetical protein